MVIPEYSLELVNKNGKIINKIENINFLKTETLSAHANFNGKINGSGKTKEEKDNKKKAKISKIKKKPKTLWMRKKKRSR